MKKILLHLMILTTLSLGASLKTDALYSINPKQFAGLSEEDLSNENDSCNLRIFINKTDASGATNDASAFISVEGGTPPYTYYWTTGDTSNAISDVSSGRYYVVVIDAVGCRAWAFVDINNMTGPQISVSNVQPVSCFGKKDGAIDIDVTGGTPPYLIRWNNGQKGTSINGLASAYYVVGVVDAAGLKSFKKIFVPEPQPLNYIADVNQPNCEQSDGSLIVSATGGTPPYTYTWIKDGATGAELSNKPAGTYPLLIEDANGCQVEKMVTLSDQQGPQLVLDSVAASTCQEADGIALVAVENPIGVNFEWSDQDDNILSSQPTAQGLTEGTYTLMISDENNCKTAHSVTVKLKRPDREPICVATIDTATDNNIVIWERQVNAVQYNIYREDVENNEYLQVGSVPYNELNYFEDTVTDPNDRGYAYKITSVDECGTESLLSEVHKLCHLSVVPQDETTSILVWDAYQGTTGLYEVQRKLEGGNWETLRELPYFRRSFKDETVVPGQVAAYRMLIPLAEPCEIQGPDKKVGSGSYSYTLSNVEDNRASATDINKLIAENLFRIYPNPSNGYLRLVMDLPLDEDVQLGIYDLSGRTVMRRSINPSDYQILELDLSREPSGIYVIHALGKSFNFRKKLVIR